MSNSTKIKSDLLGMPIGTARNRLVKSLLWKFVIETDNDICFRCGTKILTISDLSIEHKKSWQTSDSPLEKYFDLNNISFSHLSCNTSDGGKHKIRGCPSRASYRSGCRCDGCRKAYLDHHKDYKKKSYTPEKRHAQYKRTGK